MALENGYRNTKALEHVIIRSSSQLSAVSTGSNAKDEHLSIDYVLIYDVHDVVHKKQRDMFETALKRKGLLLDKVTSGQKVFVKVHCPFELLTREAETVKIEMPLKDCPIESDEEGFFNRIFKKFRTDEEVDYVSGPFIHAKLHCYEGHEKPDQFFRSSIRSLLVHHMLINLDSTSHLLYDTTSTEPKVKQGLLTLVSKGVYKDAFILHDQSKDDPHYVKVKRRFPDVYEAIITKLEGYTDARHELNKTWRKWWKFQPLWRIRYYFGEEITFYFAWHGYLITCLWVPAIVGLLLFLYGLYTALKSKQSLVCYCIANNITEDTAVYNLQNTSNPVYTEDCEKEQSLLKLATKNFFWVLKESFNNRYNPQFSLFICVWGSVFLELWKRKQSTLAYEWDCNNYDDTEPDRPEFVGTEIRKDPITKEHIWVFPEFDRIKRLFLSTLLILGMMCLVFLTMAGVIALKVWCREYLDCPPDTENWKECFEKADYDSVLCMLVGTLLPAAASALSVLGWESIYAVVAEKLVSFENYQTKSDQSNALIIKLFMFQFVNSYSILFYIALVRPSSHGLQGNGIFNLGPEYSDTCESEGCLSLLALQVLLLMIAKPTAKFIIDVIIPWIQKQWRTLKKALRSGNVVGSLTHLRRTSSSVGLEEGSSYLMREYQKPSIQDFTLWEFNEKTIQFGYIVMFASSFPLAPFLALIINLVDLRIDARRLLWFNRRPVAFISSDIGTWFSIMRFVNFCGIVSNAILIASASRMTRGEDTSDKLMYLIGFEHILFVLVFLVDILIPDVPYHIKQAMRREKYQVAKVLEDGEVPKPESGGSNFSSYGRSMLSRPPSCRSLIETDVFSEALQRLRDPRSSYKSIHRLFAENVPPSAEHRRSTIFTLGVLPNEPQNQGDAVARPDDDARSSARLIPGDSTTPSPEYPVPTELLKEVPKSEKELEADGQVVGIQNGEVMGLENGRPLRTMSQPLPKVPKGSFRPQKYATSPGYAGGRPSGRPNIPSR